MALSEAITIRCDGDGCPISADVEDKARRPEGWYHVKLATADGRLQPHEGFDLCSLRCVQRWAKARSAAIGETNGRVGGTYAKTAECPECHEMFAPQGLNLHRSSAHGVAVSKANA